MNKMLVSSVIVAGLLMISAQAAENKAEAPVAKAEVAQKTVAKKAMMEVKGEFVIRKASITRNEASKKGKIVAHLKKGEKISIDSCNKYSWCKLSGKKEFISKNVLKKVK